MDKGPQGENQNFTAFKRSYKRLSLLHQSMDRVSDRTWKVSTTEERIHMSDYITVETSPWQRML